MEFLPQLDFAAVHIDEERPCFFGLKYGITVPASSGIVQGGSGGIHAGVGHVLCLLIFGLRAPVSYFPIHWVLIV
jgi:hypothetical protein